jgi:hypothetical protein
MSEKRRMDQVKPTQQVPCFVYFPLILLPTEWCALSDGCLLEICFGFFSVHTNGERERVCV